MTVRVKELRVGWTAGSPLVCRLIRRCDFAIVDGVRVPSAINHVLLHFIFRGDGPDLIYEAGPWGIESSPFVHLEAALDSGRVTRLIEWAVPLDEPDLNAIWIHASNLHGDGYDYRMLAFYLIWTKILGKKPSRWLFRMDNKRRFTCNEFVVTVLEGLIPEVPVGADKSFTPEGLFNRIVGIPSPVFIQEHSPREPRRYLDFGSPK